MALRYAPVSAAHCRSPRTFFFRPVGVGTGHRRIVGAKHRDGQWRRRRRGAVRYRIGEGVVDQRLAFSEGLHRRVAVVHHIAVGAIRPDGQRAIEAMDDRAVRRGGPGRNRQVLVRVLDVGDGQRRPIVDIGIGVIGE